MPGRLGTAAERPALVPAMLAMSETRCSEAADRRARRRGKPEFRSCARYMATREEKRRLFAGHPLFGRLAPAELDALLSHARSERYPANARIFEQGSPGRSMHAVLRGSVKISALSPLGKQVVLATISAGEVFGEIALLDGGERTADATAMTDCNLLVIDHRDLLPFLERHNELCILVLRLLAQRLRQTDRFIEEMLFAQLGPRLAAALLRLARAAGAAKHGARPVVHVSQAELGRMIGSARESVNKQLQVWHRLGMVELGKRLVVIRDQDALEALVA